MVETYTQVIFADSVRFYHVSRHGFEVCYRKNKEEGSKGGGPFPISWEIYLVCI